MTTNEILYTATLTESENDKGKTTRAYEQNAEFAVFIQSVNNAVVSQRESGVPIGSGNLWEIWWDTETPTLTAGDFVFRNSKQYKVIDAETKRGISGAVVHKAWIQSTKGSV